MKESIRAVLVDDEADSIGVLQILLKKYAPEVVVRATFTNSKEALEYLRQEETDVLFLDIEMPGLDGFELLSKLGSFSFKPIFVSAYDEFGVKAIKYRIFDYLVKPIDPEELLQTIRRLKNELAEEEKVNIEKIDHVSILHDKILIPVGNEYEFVQISEIVRCEADDNYTRLYLGDQVFLVSKTLKYFEEVLPASHFLRTHNKHLINVNKIKKYVKSDGGYFELTSGGTIPLSRYRKEDVLKRLGLA
ncbi:MAG: response regulator [Saprospiraceae bacterium]|nr:response regulator [Saprospiraceae bacterium]